MASHDEGPGGPGLLWCPSGSAYAAESVVLAVRDGPDGPPAYLPAPRPAAEALAGLPPGTEPRRLLRLASHCVPHCLNRAGDTCTLATRLTAAPPPPAVTPLPGCHLRPSCKWWTQSGPPACRACPSVATRPAPPR
ncbi:hypothetical protein J7F03_37650 [Streptomyces sp. ISL-43]|uniref:hypothetical protein n=1 Tax=Streptomyces sp. ISL-43 TaxID=2819183 RepID=UPI001BE7B9CD|nr:hypothetical protein [Streptomyces sp. ISL-43]MBT2452669.1 hypothetical protein [Streptomyces sp. ISL-43]